MPSLVFFFQAEDGIRDFCLSRGLGDVYKRQKVMLLSDLNKGAEDPVTTCLIVGDFYDLFTKEPNKAATAEALRLILSQ